jgi:hypothetical protein
VVKTITKIGTEFNFEKSNFDFFANVFLGFDLSGNKKLKVNFVKGDKNEFEVESDDPQKMFYGGQVGGSYKINESFSVKAYSGLELNDKLTNYNFGAGVQYKL